MKLNIKNFSNVLSFLLNGIFDGNTHIITINVSNCTYDYSGDTTIQAGEDLTITFTPDDGYELNRDCFQIYGQYATIVRNKDLSYTITITSIENDITIDATAIEQEDELSLPDIVKEKILDEAYTIDVTCSIPEIQMSINGENYLQSCSLDIDRFIKDQGVIGSFVANEFDLKLMNFPNIDLTGLTLEVMATITYAIEGTSYNQELTIGKFTISSSEYDDTAGTHDIVAYDNALLYNIDYVPSVTFPCTTIDLLNDVLAQTGQSLENSETRYTYTVPEDGLSSGYYYMVIDDTNYGFILDDDLSFYDSILATTSEVTIRHVASDYSTVYYKSIALETLSDTSDYTQLSVNTVNYKPFNNDMFVIPSNQFDVTTVDVDSDEDVEVTHVTCRSVIQDIVKLAYGWAYITKDGYLNFKKVTPLLNGNCNNYDIMGYTVQDTPDDETAIISPNNPAEVSYFSWGVASVTINNCYIAGETETTSLDGLDVLAYGSQITISAGTSTNTDTSTNSWSVYYVVPEAMYIRYENTTDDITPYTTYIRDGETITATNGTILLEKDDIVTSFGYQINASTTLDEDLNINVMFATNTYYNEEYVDWSGEYTAYGLLSYVDDEHYCSLTYTYDETDEYYGYTILNWGSMYAYGAALTWAYDSDEEVFYASLPTTFDISDDVSLPITATDGTTLICKYYEGLGSDEDYGMYITDNVVYVKNVDITTIDDWNTWVSSVASDFIIVYGLSTQYNIPAYTISEELLTAMEEYKYYKYKTILFSSKGVEYLTLTKQTNIDTTYCALDTNHYFKCDQTGEATKPINKILIGLSDIEGENVYITSDDYDEDDESCLYIYDNNITNTPELRTIALREGTQELFDLYYTPLDIEIPGAPWIINCEPYLFTNVDEDTLLGYAFSSHFDYKGYITQSITSQASSQTETEYSYDDSYTAAINQTRYIVDKQNQQIQSLITTVDGNTTNISTIIQTVENWTADFESVGGDNYVKNSVGLGDASNLVWSLTGDTDTSVYYYGSTSEAALYTKSGSRWYLNGYKMTQTINVLQNSTYAFSCVIKKPADSSESCYISIYDTNNTSNIKTITPDASTAYDYETFTLSGDDAFTPQTTNITIEIYASEGCQLTISDIMLNAGSICSIWSPASGEILTTNVKMDAGGLRVLSSDYINNGLGDYTIMTPSYFQGYGNNNGTEECVFQVSGTETITYDLQTRNSMLIGDASSTHYNTKVVPIVESDYDGIAFIKSKGE